MPSYLIVIYYTNGGNSSGIRYSNLATTEQVQDAVREKMRESGKLGIVAYIYVTLTNKLAEKDL